MTQTILHYCQSSQRITISSRAIILDTICYHKSGHPVCSARSLGSVDIIRYHSVGVVYACVSSAIRVRTGSPRA